MLEFWAVLGVVVIVLEILGVISAIAAVLTARTTQGALAWAVALVAIPVVSVPLYWVLGRSKFQGYVSAMRERNLGVLGIDDSIVSNIKPFVVPLTDSMGDARVLNELASLPFTKGNDTRLLIDGEETFQALFSAIDQARDYVLAEFFIVHDDQLGREFKDTLMRAAKRNCRVYLLYDEVGSQKMTKGYLSDLQTAGVQVSGMRTTRGWTNRFQLNFRNHRKIVVLDGKVAFVGGHNVGDEYVHRGPKLTPWRDTHIQFEGPAVMSAQLAFLEDWNWATRSLPDVNWQAQEGRRGDNNVVFVLPSGPADRYETCGLFFTHAINSAERRLWIASPYFVPDEALIGALKLAAMRGVDVRILIPGLPDKPLIKMAAIEYVAAVTETGVRVFEYAPGFLHQKVVLIDESVSIVGTANFDNRSFRLNFEASVVTVDKKFAAETEEMLSADFSTSSELTAEKLAQRSLLARLGSRFARLFSPVL